MDMLPMEHKNKGNCYTETRYAGDRSLIVEGMESVVATVSGYHGSERFKLIKLITLAGANFVGAMNRSTTHLVCWRFVGKKYDLAKSTGVHVVNHRWYEDCLMKGRLLDEGPYSMLSGEELGPISSQVLTLLERNEKREWFNSNDSKRSNSNSVASSIAPVLKLDDETADFGCSQWCNSQLLEENSISSRDFEMTAACYAKKRRGHSSKRHKSMQETVCKPLNVVSESLTESPSFTSNTVVGGRKERSRKAGSSLVELAGSICEGYLPPSRSTSLDLKFDNDQIFDLLEVEGARSNIVPDDLDHMRNLDCEIFGNDVFSCKSNHDKPKEELSCVICWVEFSSTRGVLPCGHRFCFKCIQNWSDCLSSQGKSSTCPLCKAHFTKIYKLDDAETTDQNIFSQTIPSQASNISIPIVYNAEISHLTSTSSAAARICCECQNLEPEELLVCCHICRMRFVHSYCLDPPIDPWTCVHCRDHRSLYLHFR